MERLRSSSRASGPVKTWHTVLRVALCLLVAWAFSAGGSSLSFNGVIFLALALMASVLGAYELAIREVEGKWILVWMTGACVLGYACFGLWWLYRPKPFTGPLTPANEPSPPMTCRDTPVGGDLVMAIGSDRGIGKGDGPFTPFAVGDCSGPSFRRVPGGLMVSEIFYDLTSSIAMTLTDNKFEALRPVAIRFFRPDPHTLVLLDHFDTEVLYVRWLNPTTVRIRGRFFCGEEPRAVIGDNRTMIGGIRIMGLYFGQHASHGRICTRLKPGEDGPRLGL